MEEDDGSPRLRLVIVDRQHPPLRWQQIEQAAGFGGRGQAPLLALARPVDDRLRIRSREGHAMLRGRETGAEGLLPLDELATEAVLACAHRQALPRVTAGAWHSVEPPKDEERCAVGGPVKLIDPRIILFRRDLPRHRPRLEHKQRPDVSIRLLPDAKDSQTLA